MLQSQKLTVRASEIRTRLNEIAGLPDDAMNDDVVKETDKLNGEYQHVEARLRAAITAEAAETREAEAERAKGAPADDGDPELRELRDLQGKASIARYLRAFHDGVQLAGAEKELCEARSLTPSGQYIPFDVLLPPVGDDAPETRADVTTPGLTAAQGQPTTQHEILQRVFADTATAMLGVVMPSVGVGVQNYPRITTGAGAEFVAAGAAKEATAGAITDNTLRPVRLAARVQFDEVDTLTTAGLEESLRQDVVSAVGDRLDAQLMGLGDANVRGFLATAANGGLADYANPTAVVDFEAAAVQAARGVDGFYASREDQCTWVIGVPTYQKLASLFVTNAAVSATRSLRETLRGFMASAHIPAVASDIQQGILLKGGKDVGIRSVAPVWEGLRLKRDEETEAASGKVQITVGLYTNFALVRPAAYVRTKLKVA